jgi:hypothetical protein
MICERICYRRSNIKKETFLIHQSDCNVISPDKNKQLKVMHISFISLEIISFL